MVSRKQARMIDTLEVFKVSPIISRFKKIHIFGDAPDGISNNKAVISMIEVSYVDFSNAKNGFDNGRFFGPIVRVMKVKEPRNINKTAKLRRPISSFIIKHTRTLHHDQITLP